MGKSKELATLTDDGGTFSGSLSVTGSNFASTTYTGTSVNQTGVYTGLTSDGGFTNNVRDSGYLQLSTNNVERMRIDASGRVTMPYQPSYMASEGQSVVSSGTVVKYSNVAFNIGNHYNSTNGRFTAPVTGIYAVGCYIQAHQTTHQTYTSITFQKNGSQYGESELVQTWAGGSDHTVTGGVTLMQLNAGDYAQVYAGRGYRGIQGHSFAYLVG